MSDNIPFEIQEEIMKRLPIKPLLQFRLVSKAWKSLIDSSAFIHKYQYTQPHILIRNNCDRNYVSVVDDDTFPRQKVSLILPESAKQLSYPILFGSSQGLFCLYSFHELENDTFRLSKTAFIWNPTIRKAVVISMPDELDTQYQYDTTVGFGVCPCSLDPILIYIRMEYTSEVINSMTRITWLAEVFRLSSGSWKSLSINLPRSTTALLDEFKHVAINKYINWGAYDMTDGSRKILSFDMISEEFTEIHLPNDLAGIPDMDLYICKIKESLAVLQFDGEVDAPDYHVWMMGNGDIKSFTKIYTIMSNSLEARVEGVFGSRKSGEPIFAMKSQSEEDYELVEYKPNSGHVNHIGISAKGSLFFVSSYTETLLLLNY